MARHPRSADVDWVFDALNADGGIQTAHPERRGWAARLRRRGPLPTVTYLGGTD